MERDSFEVAQIQSKRSNWSISFRVTDDTQSNLNFLEHESKNMNYEPTPQQPITGWLAEPGRTPTFQKWMDSLEERRVRRARPYISDLVSSKGPRNYATPHQR